MRYERREEARPRIHPPALSCRDRRSLPSHNPPGYLRLVMERTAARIRQRPELTSLDCQTSSLLLSRKIVLQTVYHIFLNKNRGKRKLFTAGITGGMAAATEELKKSFGFRGLHDRIEHDSLNREHN